MKLKTEDRQKSSAFQELSKNIREGFFLEELIIASPDARLFPFSYLLVYKEEERKYAYKVIQRIRVAFFENTLQFYWKKFSNTTGKFRIRYFIASR